MIRKGLCTMDEKQTVESGITLVELFQMLFRHIFLICLITIGVTIIGLVYTLKLIEPTYEAKTDIMVQVNKGSGNGTTANDIDLTTTLRIVETVADFMKKDIVLDKTIEDLELDITPNRIRNNLKIQYSSSSLLINLSYEDHDPELAATILNEIVDNTIEIANSSFPVLNDTISKVGYAKKGTYSSPNKTLNTIISFILGGIIGVVVALLLEALKTTIRNKKDLEALIPNYQVIGVIPQLDEEE